jgi:predicted aspartyl protease
MEGMLVGEIRAKVLLTNSVDEALHRRKKLKKSQVRRYEADAMVDTGAVRPIIPAHVMQQLGVLSCGDRVAEYADGRKDTVPVTEPIIFEILGRDTQTEALVRGEEIVVGYTILAKLDLLVDRANCRLVPNPAHPDQPVSRV